MKKIKSSLRKNFDDIKALQRDVKVNLNTLNLSKVDYNLLAKYSCKFSDIKGKFNLIVDQFRDELGYKYFTEISENKSNINHIE